MQTKKVAILVAFVLFGLTFSSCRQCGKKETKPADRNGKASNTKTSKPLTPEEEELMAKAQSELANAAKAAVAARVAQRTMTKRMKVVVVTGAGTEAESQAKAANDAADATEEARGSMNLKIATVAKAVELLAKYATWQAKEAVRGGMGGLWPDIPAADADIKKAAKVYDDMRKAYPSALDIAKDAYEKAGGKKNDLDLCLKGSV